MMLTIGLIDNFVITRLGLGILINEHFTDNTILEAGNINEFETLHKLKSPDLIILGNNFLHEDKCLAAARHVKRQHPQIPIIVYDEQLLQNLTVSYFRAGISGYLLRRDTATEMINCIEAVLNHKKFLCPALYDQLLESFGKTKTQNEPVKNTILTPREQEIARFLSQGMKTTSISTLLERKPSTISSIKHNIFKKLNIKNIVELREALLDVTH